MKYVIRTVGLFLLLLTLVGCENQDSYSFTVVTGGHHRYQAGDKLNGELVVLGGTVMLESGSQLTGSLILLDGMVEMAGTVQGDVFHLSGRLTLQPQAQIAGDFNQGGGELVGNPEDVVRGVVNTGTGVQLPNLPEVTPPTPQEQMLRILLQSLITGFIAYGITRLAPRSVQRISRVTVEYPVVCAALGLLILIVSPALLLAMAFTILLIPLTLIGSLLLIAMVVYGWTGLWLLIGQRLSRLLQRNISPAQAAMVGAIVLTLLSEALGLFAPMLGLLLLAITGALGLGAVALTRFGSQRYTAPVDSLETQTLQEM